MSKQSGLADLVGRRIVAVTVTESEGPPRLQLFLTLDDGRYYEVWSREADIGFGSMSYDGGLQEVHSEGRRDAEIVFEVVDDDVGAVASPPG